MTHHPARRPLFALLLLVSALLAAAPGAGAAIFNSIDAGTDSTCGVRPGGSVWCWGDGRAGQIGVIGASRARVPLAVIGTYTATQVSVGQAYWCARLVDATVECTGAGNLGQIGNGQATNAQYPKEVALPNVSMVSAGQSTTCAVSSGDVWCWGDDTRGQLGDGKLGTQATPSPVKVPGVSGILSVSSGSAHVCAVRSDGAVVCWGDAADGKLGYDSASALAVPGPPVGGVAGAVQVATGTNHACALRADGTVACWGRNELGQLGVGTPGVPSPVALPVPGLAGVTQLSTGTNTTCAVKGDGTVWCWGDGVRGQLGNGARLRSGLPVQVTGLTDAIDVGVGNQHACAVRRDLRTFCWGSNQYAQLGDGAVIGTAAADPSPQLVDDSPAGQAIFFPTPLNERGKTSRGGRVELRVYRVKRARGFRTCPSYAYVTVRSKGKEVKRRVTDIEAVSGGCAVTARISLPENTQRASSAVFLVQSKKLKTVKHRVKPRVTT